MKSLSNKSELKNLVKECVREVMFEEGIISDLVSEIAAGFVKANLLENRSVQPRQTYSTTERVMERKREPVVERQSFTENKNKVSETLKKIYGGMDLFEGTTPAPPESSSKTNGPLSGVDPNDSGVDISNIPGMKVWKKLI
jgi:hypothetical protein